MDDLTRECLVMHAAVSITGHDVIRFRGQPASILTDNGPEFAGKALDLWTHDTGISHLFTRPERGHRRP